MTDIPSGVVPPPPNLQTTGSLADVLVGRATLLSGIEQDPDEPDFDRVYVGPRWKWQYVLVKHGTVDLGPAHSFTTLPSGAPIYQDERGVNRV